jgi:hypothetical protein
VSLRHPKAVEWEQRLKEVFDRIDDILEERHGHRHLLHPTRPKRHATANREDDGLFDVGASFTAGFGSAHGAGYVVELRVATLARVPDAERERLENEVVDLLREQLPVAFPGRQLRVVRDGHVIKIVGDLSLGTL